MANWKFELTTETNLYGEFRIRALADFGDIKSGDLGGFVSSEDCISFDIDDTSWVYDNSRVYNSSVENNSRVYNNSSVENSSVENSSVYNNSSVENSSSVYNSSVENSSSVYNSRVDNSRVENSSSVYNSRVDSSSVYNSSVTKSTKSISGLIWQVSFTDENITIGCETHKTAEWEAFTDRQISRMESRALEFWNTYKTIILNLAKIHQQSINTEAR